MNKILFALLFCPMFAFAVIQDGEVTQRKLNINTSAAPDLRNCTIAASVATSALTIDLKNNAGADLSTLTPCLVSFRSSTAATGTYSQVSISSATTITIPSATTIGTASAKAETIYVYLINNSGTAELAVSLNLFDDGSIQTSTAISGGTSRTTLYSTAARTSKAIRLIGRLVVTEGTAGTWATAPSEVVSGRFQAAPLQAGYLGSCIWVAAASCNWGTITNANFTSFSVDSDCTTPTASGSAFVSVPGTKLPACVVTNGPPGVYKLEAKGWLGITGGNQSNRGFRFYDGTTGFGVQNGGASNQTVTGLSGMISYTTAVTKTFEVQCQATSTDSCQIVNSASNYPFQIDIYYYPALP